MKIVVDTGPLVALLDRSDPHHAWARATFEELMERYAPMDFADACVVAMAEIHHPATVVTIDRRDFARYRIFGRNAIRTCMP